MTVTKRYTNDLVIVAPAVTINGIKPTVKPRAHDSSYSPVAMYQLDGNMNDSIGSNHFSVTAGTELYGYCKGLKGFAFNGSTTIAGSTASPALYGDMTAECLLNVARVHTVQQRIFHESGASNSELASQNSLWALDVTATNNALQHSSEYNAGSNNIYLTTMSVPVGEIVHLAMVRASDQVSLYMNGILAAGPSSTLNTPTSGENAHMEFGGATGATAVYLVGWMASVKIIASALTADQVLREANYTLYGGV